MRRKHRLIKVSNGSDFDAGTVSLEMLVVDWLCRGRRTPPVFERSTIGLGGGSGAYAGGGVDRGTEIPESALDNSDEARPEPEEELDFLRRCPGLTIAICDGCDEF